MDIGTLLAVHCSVQGISVWQSNIWHTDAGYQVLAKRPIQVGDTVKHYYVSLVCTDLGMHPQGLERYGEIVTHVTVDRLNVYSNELSDEVSDGYEKKQTVWIRPAPLCASHTSTRVGIGTAMRT